MHPTPRELALTIWQAGVDAVRAEVLIDRQVSVRDQQLFIAGMEFPLHDVRRICVVGAGKAAGYLGLAMEASLASLASLASIAETHGLHGWINVPENCVEPTRFLTLHAGRPAGVNEPCQAGVLGTQRIMSLVGELHADDLCICLLTGGGSALLPAPAAGVTLQDKLQVTRLLSENGADIGDLNRVRTALSQVKGGGLARACNAGQLVTLVISDVLGDPLDLIASGPTMPPRFSAADSKSPFDIYAQYADPGLLAEHVQQRLKQPITFNHATSCQVTHHILGNNQTAVDAASAAAQGLGLQVFQIAPEHPTTPAEAVAKQLVDKMRELDASTTGPYCVIHGGEPIVQLADRDQRGKGGRNQQLILAALECLSAELTPHHIRNICLLSGGTDGEDGPTDAAGAVLDQSIVETARQRGKQPAEFLLRNDAFHFFDDLGGLIRTGPTHTNVCDLRVLVNLQGKSS